MIKYYKRREGYYSHNPIIMEQNVSYYKFDEENRMFYKIVNSKWHCVNYQCNDVWATEMGYTEIEPDDSEMMLEML